MSKVDLFNYQLNLFERICSLDELERGFRSVKKNGGAPGVDGVTVEEFASRLPEELMRLKNDVESWIYEPRPVKRVEIPKATGSGIRKLGIPTVRDRILHAAIKAVLEPILDPMFSENSYGFRPGKSQRQAVEAAQQVVQSGKEYIVDIDLASFFDRLHHDKLISRLGLFIREKRVLRLIGIILRSGIMEDGLVKSTSEGSVQGSPLSPLLSNVVLDEVDKELERRGLAFCRFADDQQITLLKKLNSGNIQDAAEEFWKWDHLKGKRVPGLRRRRERERQLFSRNRDPGQTGDHGSFSDLRLRHGGSGLRTENPDPALYPGIAYLEKVFK